MLDSSEYHRETFDDTRFRALIEKSKEVVLLLDRTGHVTYASPSAIRLLGYSPDELAREPDLFSILHEEDRASVREVYLNLLNKANATIHVEYRVHKKGGGIRWLESAMTNYSDDPEIRSVVVNSQDITERKEAEKDMANARNYAENIIETVREPLLVLDPDGCVRRANRAFYATFQVAPRETISRPLTELGNGQWDVPRLTKLLVEMLPLKREIEGFEVTARFPHIGEKIMLLNARRIVPPDGDANSILLAVEDITDRRLAERQVNASEQRFRSLVENGTDGITVSNAEGMFTYASPTVNRLLGYSPEQYLGMNARSAIHPEDRSHVESTVADIMKNPGNTATIQLRARHKDGTYRWLESTLTNLLHDPAIKGIVTNFRDITEIKQYVQDLQRGETLLNAILSSLNAHLAVLDKNGTIIAVNQAWNEFSRANGQENLKLTGVGTNYLNVLADSRDSPEAPLVEKGIADVLSGSADSFTLEYPCDSPNAKRWYLLQVTPLRYPEGGVVVSHMDITERKRVERQKDDFVGIASHELKTPVTSLKAYAQVLQSRFKKGGDRRSADLLEKMNLQLDRLTDLITDLLDVTKIEAGKLVFHEATYDFDTLVNEVVEETQRTTDKHRIVVRGSVGRPVFGDRERVGQVLVNLLSNALKYSPHSETVIVELKPEKTQFTVNVQDFGVGIPGDNKERVFGRFVRISGPHRDTFPGLGLGLYITKQLVTRMGGSISVESVEGKGSTFSFTLPDEHGAQE
jgi:two-component system CheB/CheR fusion protein